jgi:hypothetical protein
VQRTASGPDRLSVGFGPGQRLGFANVTGQNVVGDAGWDKEYVLIPGDHVITVEVSAPAGAQLGYSLMVAAPLSGRVIRRRGLGPG